MLFAESKFWHKVHQKKCKLKYINYVNYTFNNYFVCISIAIKFPVFIKSKNICNQKKYLINFNKCLLCFYALLILLHLLIKTSDSEYFFLDWNKRKIGKYVSVLYYYCKIRHEQNVVSCFVILFAQIRSNSNTSWIITFCSWWVNLTQH